MFRFGRRIAQKREARVIAQSGGTSCALQTHCARLSQQTAVVAGPFCDFVLRKLPRNRAGSWPTRECGPAKALVLMTFCLVDRPRAGLLVKNVAGAVDLDFALPAILPHNLHGDRINRTRFKTDQQLLDYHVRWH